MEFLIKSEHRRKLAHMPKNYLHSCLNQFPEVSKKLWGKPFDLKTLEEKVKVLKSGKVRINDILEHFGYFQNTELWWFNKYWILPSLNDLSPEQQKKTFSFSQLSRGNEKEVTQDLLSVFRHIELVSIILRFICPDSFGILSPPVEHVLALRRGGNAVETYLNYLCDLRFVRDEYKFKTAAEADKALWVLHHKCYDNSRNDPKIKQAFEKDELMLQLRAKNLVAPLSDISLAWRTIAFHTIDNDLTVLIGCYALEKYVKELAIVEKVEKEAKRSAEKEGKKGPTLDDRIKALDNKGKLFFLTLGHGNLDYLSNLDYLRKIRNDVFHGEKIAEIEQEKIRWLVETVLKLEQRLEKGKPSDPT